MRVGSAFASLFTVLLGSAAAHADVELRDAITPGAEDREAHGYAEVRLGALGLTPMVPGQSGLVMGGALEGSVGIGIRSFDLGFVSRFGSLAGHETSASQRYFACGPELAVRKPLGGFATFRTGLVPTYALTTDGVSTQGRIGLDLLVQVLFALEDRTRPAWRAGLGLRVGRWVGTQGEGTGTTLGVDLIVRSWW